MKLIANVVLLSGIIAFTTQDIIGRKGCDCSICRGVDNKLSPIIGNKVNDDVRGKSSCNICEKRKEMLRLERERQRKLQKCPFEILGSSTIKGKNSQEIFDEFRELIIPSQNGFFDMMRGVIKTMHTSSEAELKWAKEKEAKEMAKKKEEELKKIKESKSKKQEELISLQNPINPKVTVVLKQTPCGQILAPNENVEPEKVPLIKRLPKEANENTMSHLHPIENTAHDLGDMNYMNFDSKETQINSDLLDQLVGFNMWSTLPPQGTTDLIELQGDVFAFREENNLIEVTTDSPLVKFIGDDELKAQWKSSRSFADDIDMNLNLLPSNGEGLQEVDEKISGESQLIPL